MVATKDCNAVAKSHLEANEERNCLNRVVAAVDVVAGEEVIGLRRIAANLEELHEVVELAVNVTADGNRHAHGLHTGLFSEDFFRLHSREEKGSEIGRKALTCWQSSLTSFSGSGLQLIRLSTCWSSLAISFMLKPETVEVVVIF